MAELRIRDPTTLEVLFVDRGQVFRRHLRKKHDTSTRRVLPFLRPSRRGKPGEAALLIHHRSNRAAIYCSLTRQT